MLEAKVKELNANQSNWTYAEKTREIKDEMAKTDK